ncbi:MAG TPA: aa3-type cytochrome c oxidase subunit IV [Devosia sp.]|nr:aa3-type cytochrome c oxidase subunit IV [Devosia sp.]
MDYAEHEKTYNGFIAGVKWSVISLAVLLVILYFVVNP